MAVYQAFCEVKDMAARQLVNGMTFNSMAVMVPWLSELTASDRSLLGKDWWRYGLKANAAAMEAVLRYHHEQGIIAPPNSVVEAYRSMHTPSVS